MRRFLLSVFDLIFLANFICRAALNSVLTRLAAPGFLHVCPHAFIRLTPD
jgi:hypothetical protein